MSETTEPEYVTCDVRLADGSVAKAGSFLQPRITEVCDCPEPNALAAVVDVYQWDDGNDVRTWSVPAQVYNIPRRSLGEIVRAWDEEKP